MLKFFLKGLNYILKKVVQPSGVKPFRLAKLRQKMKRLSGKKRYATGFNVAAKGVRNKLVRLVRLVKSLGFVLLEEVMKFNLLVKHRNTRIAFRPIKAFILAS